MKYTFFKKMVHKQVGLQRPENKKVKGYTPYTLFYKKVVYKKLFIEEARNRQLFFTFGAKIAENGKFSP